MDSPRFKGWNRRGYLPHFDAPNQLQGITFRLADSIPRRLIEQWTRDLESLEDEERQRRLHQQIARHEDRGLGACLLRDPGNARIVADNLRHFDGERYQLLEWCIMPNHVHVLLRCLPSCPLDQIVRSWKSFTARSINRRLGRSGRFWHPDYYDRLIRDEDHLESARHYIRRNPVSAGLCSRPEDWPFSSATKP